MENLETFVELSHSFPWASKLRKSYKRLIKSETEEQKWENMNKFITRSARLVNKNIGENASSFEEIDIHLVHNFLKELIVVLHQEHSKLVEEFEEFDQQVLPVLLKYFYVSIYIDGMVEDSTRGMKDIIDFLMVLPCHPQSASSQHIRVRYFVQKLVALNNSQTFSTPPNPKRKHIDTPMPLRKDPDSIADFESSPQDNHFDPDSTLTLEVASTPYQVTPSTPATRLTSPVTELGTAEKKFELLSIDTEKVDISNTVEKVPVDESVMEVVPNEPGKNSEEAAEDDQSDDVEILPPSPSSSSSSQIFSSTKVSFSRCLILPQGLVTREEVKQSSPKFVAETPEPPELDKSQDEDAEIIETVALIHPPPPSSMITEFESIEGISPIIWEKSGLNEDDVNSTRGPDSQASPDMETTITGPIEESQMLPKAEEIPVHSSDVAISLVNSQPAPDPLKDLPVQLSALQALLRKRFRNPFITPTEKLLYKFQRRLGRMKRRPPRPVWIVTKRRIPVYPPKIDDNNNSTALQTDKNESIDLSQSLLTKELDRSLRNLEREEAGSSNEGFVIRQPFSSQDDMNVNSAKEFNAEVCDALSDQISCVKEEPSIAASNDGRHSPDSGCEVQIEESCLFNKTEPESSVKETIEKVSPVTSETAGDALKVAKEATACDLLGCSSSDSDAEFLEEIKSNIAAWVSQTEEGNQEPVVNDNGQFPLPPFSFSSPADDVEPDIKLMGQSAKLASPIIPASPKRKYLRRSVRLASLQNASLSSFASSSGTPSRKRRTPPSDVADECDELRTGSGLVKISRMVVWDELVKYLPPCWIDLLQEHVRDCNATRQFLVNSNPGGPCPTITCKCSLSRPKM